MLFQALFLYLKQAIQTPPDLPPRMGPSEGRMSSFVAGLNKNQIKPFLQICFHNANPQCQRRWSYLVPIHVWHRISKPLTFGSDLLGDWCFIAEQAAPAPHLPVPITVPPVTRSNLPILPTAYGGIAANAP